MSIVVTGANGKLGRGVVDALLARGVPAADIVATGRSSASLADHAERGVTVRQADFGDPASLTAAFAGATRVLLISGNDMSVRVQQHRNVIAAAVQAGVELLAYTSIPHADSATSLLAQSHRATEVDILASGLPWALLRNSWYVENYTAQLPTYLEHGLAGSAADGRVSAAARADYAEAAAVVLSSDGHAEATYELGGPAFTMPELAAVVAEASGRPLAYTDLPYDAFVQVLAGAGVPPAMAEVLADADLGLARGELYVAGDELATLLGRPLEPWQAQVRQAVADVLATRA